MEINGGGCDTFKNKIQVFNTIVHIIKKYKPDFIIFEGLLYGKTFLFASNLKNYIKKYNYEYIGITMTCDFEFALQRLQKRKENSDINIEAFYNTWKSVLVSHNKLIKSGAKMKLVDITNIKLQDMCNILIEEVENGKTMWKL